VHAHALEKVQTQIVNFIASTTMPPKLILSLQKIMFTHRR